MTGTDGIAFRAVADRLSVLGLSGKALDFGCGSGRSTRFLKSLRFDVVGVDVSEAMIAEARHRDPDGTYLRCPPESRLPFADASFDLVFSSWVVLELGTREALSGYFREMARLLRPRATAFVVSNTAEFYGHRWVSCEVDFPENAPPLRSGQIVKARLMPEGVLVTDVFWSDADYRRAAADAGLAVVEAWRPTAPSSETHWRDETSVAPWVIYELRPANRAEEGNRERRETVETN